MSYTCNAFWALVGRWGSVSLFRVGFWTVIRSSKSEEYSYNGQLLKEMFVKLLMNRSDNESPSWRKCCCLSSCCPVGTVVACRTATRIYTRAPTRVGTQSPLLLAGYFRVISTWFVLSFLQTYFPKWAIKCYRPVLTTHFLPVRCFHPL